MTVDAAQEAAFVQSVASDLFGAERVPVMADPITGSEDFSRALAEVPGAFAFVGACLPGRDPDQALDNRSPLAAFDDAVLGDGAALSAELATRRLDAAVV